MKQSLDHLEEVRAIAKNRVTRAIIYLVMNNIPLDVAEKLTGVELQAWCIIVGEIKGGEYDWALGEWKGDHDALIQVI